MARPRLPRSIRGRVVAGVAGAVVLAVLAAGLLSVVALRASLLARTDERLRDGAGTVRQALAAAGDDGLLVRDDRVRVLLEASTADLAVHLVAGDRVVETIAASGAVPAPVAVADAHALRDGPGWLPGGPALRALTVQTPGLTVAEGDAQTAVDEVVLVADVSEDRRTVTTLARIELAAGAGATVVGVVLAWWAAGAGLRPLRRMAASAERIADGDRTVRIREPAAPSETRLLATALDDALDQRAVAEQRVRDFVADAAHELRTPLTSVHGWADLYLQGALDEDGLDRAMERIGRETARMRHLVDELALLARLDAEAPLRTGPVDLRDVVGEVVADLGVLAPGRPVVWRAPARPVVVAGDRDRLVQVVQNLVGNVLRHTPATACLTVTLAAPGPTARLVVHDDGPGVPPELVSRAFDRFVRSRGTPGTDPEDAAGGPRREGSGLGLAIVAALVRAHGGTVGLDSVPGEGTTVTVELPLLR
ncbi:cell wall metabolism sensor histidine kinase WalK [Cellulomonas sp. C5510]|uniref:sensor histidine kinase n=1 Tax=Cellulomonas sp. C5510 TaxID=2871170 RepID=UPI001C951E8A|nr:HAMP domain-containing sensor histidine kinase [Cellulomonas sp. C5510]QZN85475.1 HAMP domain-containing histidine kinase [Cellulomonas sp. C5510]